MTRQIAPAEIDALAKAVREFNSWHFYDCHETLEDVWREVGEKGSEATLANFYQGLIKAAAGYHHLLRGNYAGTVKVLSDTFRLLEPYRPRTLGVDLEPLIAGIRASLGQVEGLGPEHIAQFDRSLIPTISFDPEAAA